MFFGKIPKGGQATKSLKRTMNCPKCQSEIKENQKFCKNCGAALEISEVSEAVAPVESDAAQTLETTAEIPTNTPEEAFQVAETNPEETSSTEAPKSQKAPKRFNLKKFLAITIPTVAVLLIIALNLNLIIGYAVKLFGTPAQYMAYVEAKAITANAKSYLSFYENLKENMDFSDAKSTELKLTLSDKGFDIVESFVKLNDAEVDISQFEFLKEVGLTLDTDNNGDITSSKATISLSDTEVLSADCYLDQKENFLYLGFPELSKEYIKIPYSTEMFNSMILTPGADTVITANSMDTNLLSISDGFIKAYAEENTSVPVDKLMTVIDEIMPTEKELEESISKYIKTALACVDDAKMDTTDLTVGDITNKVTQITVEVDTELVMKIALAVMKDMKEDKNIENILKRAQKSIDENIAPIDEDIYSAFIDFLEEGIETGEEELNNKNFQNEKICVLHTYVDYWHKVVGHSFVTKNAYGKNQKYLTAMVTKGSDFEYLNESPVGTVIEGKGSLQNGIMNGEMTLSYDMMGTEMDLMKISYIDYNTNEFENGNIKGSIVITPLEDLIKELELDDNIATLISLSDLSLRMDLDINRDKAQTALSISTGENPLLTVSLGTEKKESKKLNLPSKTVTIDDEEDLTKWIAGFDYAKLADNLEKADLPKEIVDAVRMLSLMSVMPS